MSDYKESKQKLEKDYNLHDGFIDFFEYDKKNKKIEMVILNPGWGFPYVHIVFENIFYFSSQEFEFHYPDPKIYCVEVTSPDDRIEELCNSIQGERFEERVLEIKNQNLIRTKIYMTSANEYEIICENIIVSDKENS